jgi:hypothetical protein
MDILDNLEDVELLSTYQINELIIGTFLFIILFVIYKNIINDINIFEVIYVGVSFFISYLTVNVIYNYITYFT